ncbi:MAG: exodeoxyribonuclease VII large subunit [Nitrospiraceae bacterium]
MHRTDVVEHRQRILTVSELTLLIRDRLEQSFPDIWVEGEVSNLRTPSSGHLYVTLKDRSSQIRAVLFKTGVQRLRFALREGLQVIVRGQLTVYEPRGEYQVVLDYLEPKGIGALQLAFDQLKEKLAGEGLFDPARKRPLPFLPRRVGVVTSLSGAAIRDILTVLERRCPILSVLIYPVPVQGENAAPLIAEAIRALGASGEVDVMIVGRGGGSPEDLWCFNDEAVVRAVAASPVPIVSAVGHEIDFTLVDFAADHRAPTPSAAAEAVAPVLEDLARSLGDLGIRRERAARLAVTLARQRLNTCRKTLPMLMLRLQRPAQRLDELSIRFRIAWQDSLTHLRDRVSACRHDLATQSPLGRVTRGLVLVPQLFKRLEAGMRSGQMGKRQALGALLSTMDSLSPLAVLARGYSILQTIPGGVIVRSARDVSVGDEVRARLAKGQLVCAVRRVLPDA